MFSTLFQRIFESESPMLASLRNREPIPVLDLMDGDKLKVYLDGFGARIFTSCADGIYCATVHRNAVSSQAKSDKSVLSAIGLAVAGLEILQLQAVR